MRCFYAQYFSTVPHRETTIESDFSREFVPPAADTKTRRHRVSNGRVRPEGFSPPQTKKVAKSIFLSSLALRGRQWFSSLIFLWPGGTSRTPAASIFSSLDLWPLHDRADVDTLSLCTHHHAKAVYEAAINLSVYVRTVLKLKEAVRVL